MAEENTAIFPAISSFQMRRKVVDGADEQMTDAGFLDLMRRWVFPAMAGTDAFGAANCIVRDQIEFDPSGLLDPFEYDDFHSVTSATVELAGAKPYTVTVEKQPDDKEHLILYTTDIDITDDLDAFSFPKNPQITTTGDNKIKQFDGGDITSSQAGLTWQLLDSQDPIPKQGTTLPPYSFGPARFVPLVLFNRKDIS